MNSAVWSSSKLVVPADWMPTTCRLQVPVLKLSKNELAADAWSCFTVAAQPPHRWMPGRVIQSIMKLRTIKTMFFVTKISVCSGASSVIIQTFAVGLHWLPKALLEVVFSTRAHVDSEIVWIKLRNNKNWWNNRTIMIASLTNLIWSPTNSL